MQTIHVSSTQQSPKSTVLIMGDQINRGIASLADKTPDDTRILFIELATKFSDKKWHKQKVHLLLSALKHFAQELREEGFEKGIQLALERILVAPDFLWRIQRDPANHPPNENYKISYVVLASRVSFFLWSGAPDDELLSLAEKERLRNPQILKNQVARMMNDEKADAFIKNFVGQWLYLRNLDNVYPLPAAFPEFDDNLRLSFKQETEMFFEEQIRENHSSVSYTHLTLPTKA